MSKRKYDYWQEKTLNDLTGVSVDRAYSEGFVFTRKGKGVMHQVRSLRVRLKDFKLNSENRRVLRKTEDVDIRREELPLKGYDWSIHKMGKEFYERRFGEGMMSASKIKEMFTDTGKANVNSVLVYKKTDAVVGYCLCVETEKLLHYAYPFYDLDVDVSNLGIGMMTKAIVWAKDTDKEFVYLGSCHDESALYKLQFDGLEWFDGKRWMDDLEKLKVVVKSDS